MTEDDLVEKAIKFFVLYSLNKGFNIEDCSIDSKYVKAIFLKELYQLNSTKFVEQISDSTKTKIGLQKGIHKGTISDKENEIERELEKELGDPNFIQIVAERTVYLLLCSSVDVHNFILSNWNMDPEKQIYNTRSHTQMGLRNWVNELITVLSPLSKYYNSVDDLVQSVGLCAHCAIQEDAPTNARNTADWMYPRSNIPKGSEFIGKIKQIDNQTNKFHKQNPTELIESFHFCFNNFIRLASNLGYCKSKQQVAIDTTHIPTGKGAPETLTISGSSSGRPKEKYGDRRWLFQIATITTYPSKFVLSVQPVFDKSSQYRRLEPQLQQLSNLDIDVDTVVCDSDYYEKKSIKKLRTHQQDWIVHAEVRGESDIAQLVDKVKESGTPEFKKGIEISTPPLTPKPNAFAYPLTKDVVNTSDSRNQSTLSHPSHTDENSGDNKERFIDTTPDKDVIPYVVGGDIDDATIRKTQVAYRTRKRIESKFGQIKDNSLADTESNDPAVRYYIMAMGCMFYNFHYMINRTLSPQYGIPLRNIPMKEWLSAIRDVAFSD